MQNFGENLMGGKLHVFKGHLCVLCCNVNMLLSLNHDSFFVHSKDCLYHKTLNIVFLHIKSPLLANKYFGGPKYSNDLLCSFTPYTKHLICKLGPSVNYKKN
jgi:hypothetical protein